MKKLNVLIPAVLLIAPAVWAHGDDTRAVDEHRPLDANATVNVSNAAGMIEVQAWDKNELSLTGELAEEVEKLEITGSASKLKIDVKLPKKVEDLGDTRLRLRVPAGVHLTAESVSADVSVQGLAGPVHIRTVSGDLGMKGSSAEVEAESVSGRVILDTPAATTVQVHSVSGDVKVKGGSGEFHTQTVSGDVEVNGRAVRKFSAETVSGDVTLDFDLAKDPDVTVETLSGEVLLKLPALPDATVQLETFSGELSSEWSKVAEDSKEVRLEGKGQGRVRLHSFSGDILLKKR